LKNLIIFDLDGVITSEESYWDCAGLTLHELLYSPLYWRVSGQPSYKPAASAREFREFSRATLPEWLILSFKARALNSNWDTGYAAICLNLIDLLRYLPERAALLPLQPYDVAWMARLRAQIAAAGLAQSWDAARLHESWREQYPFDQPVFHGATGLELFERLDACACEVLGLPVGDVFGRSRPFWRFCQQLFQEWLLGDALFTQSYGHAPAQSDKPGCLFFEEPLLPVEHIRATLEALQARGYTLGIASGRVFQEAELPLAKDGLLSYFDKQHMGTYDMVTRGEKIARAQLQYPQTDRSDGETRMLPLMPANESNSNRRTPDKLSNLALGKPHPFHFQAAADWETALQNALNGSFSPLPTPFIAVGDSTSDILSGRGAGALTIAVLTGARTPEARELFLKSQPDFVIEDVTKLPALLDEIENLGTIQKLQFERREVAEKLLRLWFARQMDLATESVHLTPKAVSLNSFNGFYTSAGQEFFFKTHVEEHGVLNEYYHADLLDQAGYNVVRPLRLLHEKDRQMVIYPVITAPVMFDLMRAQETGQELPASISAETLLEAERAECSHLLEIYARTLQPARDTSAAPIHQLFWHRLIKRFYEFYADKAFPLPESASSVGNASTDENIIEGRFIVSCPDLSGTLSAPEISPSPEIGGYGDTRARSEVPDKSGQDTINRPSMAFAPADGILRGNVTFEQIMNARWVINSIQQQQTLSELIALGQHVLDPKRVTATVIGHGDAHFGNVFLSDKPMNGVTPLARVVDASQPITLVEPGNVATPLARVVDGFISSPTQRYLYFDPAFAGHHSPLLDIVKPFFHNIFATWMYFPREVARDLRISVRVEGEQIIVDHNYHLTPIRRAMLQTKQDELLQPLVALLRERGALSEDWRDILRLALMCCPLLTVDLFDTTKRPPEIGWLGLSQALQLGNQGLPAWKENDQ
jgi:phosphoglycolate phosphatase-like HAD superfamily hydrolase